MAIADRAQASMHRSDSPVTTHAWPDAPPAFATLVDLFRASLAEAPGAPCVSFRGATWSYAAIDAWSDDIAAAIEDHPSPHGRTNRVALLAERGPLIVAGILGITKSGRAFVPIDPAQPPDRSRLILADAEPDLVLTDAASDAAAALGLNGPHVIRSTGPDGRGKRRARRNDAADSFAPAYVTYTSGSTGAPKGVICTHAGLCNLADVQRTRFGLGPSSRVLAATSIGFDASLAELLMALRCGAVLVIADRETTRSGDALAAMIRKERITHMVITPTQLAAMPLDAYPDLRVISVGGEPAPRSLVAHWAPRVMFDNAYGPVEAAIEVSHWTFREDDPGSRIGRPIRNARFELRDEAGAAAEEGELWITGPMVALGYVGAPELTAERFAPCAKTGMRSYRTGDRVRRVGVDLYDFIGRVDDQLKISGVRIEPEEVRAALAALPGVAQAAVAAERSEAGAVLIGYYVAGSAAPDRTDLMEALSRRLPAAMIPARLVAVDALPMLPSGKVDMPALKRLAEAARAPAPAAAPSDVASFVTALWRKLLNQPAVKPTDNFFELGGDSLRLTQLIFAINKTYRIKLTPAAFRGLEDLGRLIAHIEAATASSARSGTT